MAKKQKMAKKQNEELILNELVDSTINEEVSEDYNEGNIDLFERNEENINNEVEKTEEKTEEKSTMTINNVEHLDYSSRGFKSIDEAFAFIDTPYFKGLGKADQEEFINWLY